MYTYKSIIWNKYHDVFEALFMLSNKRLGKAAKLYVATIAGIEIHLNDTRDMYPLLDQLLDTTGELLVSRDMRLPHMSVLFYDRCTTICTTFLALEDEDAGFITRWALCDLTDMARPQMPDDVQYQFIANHISDMIKWMHSPIPDEMAELATSVHSAAYYMVRNAAIMEDEMPTLEKDMLELSMPGAAIPENTDGWLFVVNIGIEVMNNPDDLSEDARKYLAARRQMAGLPDLAEGEPLTFVEEERKVPEPVLPQGIQMPTPPEDVTQIQFEGEPGEYYEEPTSYFKEPDDVHRINFVGQG